MKCRYRFMMLVSLLSIMAIGCANKEAEKPTIREYNTSYIMNKCNTTEKIAGDISVCLEQDGSKKIVKVYNDIINGRGQYTLQDKDKKWTLVVDNSVITEVKTENGELLLSLKEKTEEEQSIIEVKSEKEEIKPEQEKEETSTTQKLYLAEELKTKFAKIIERNEDNTILTVIPTGYITPNTKIGDYTLGEIVTDIELIDNDYDTQLFYNIIATTLLEPELFNEDNKKGLTLCYILTSIPDKFTGFYLVDTTVNENENSYNYRIENTDGLNYEITYYVQTNKYRVNNMDFTGNLLSNDIIMKYYPVYSSRLQAYDFEKTEDLPDVDDFKKEENNEGIIHYNSIKLTLEDIEGIEPYEKEIERAIFAFYGCDIKEISLDNFTINNTARATMEDGHVCVIFISDIISGINVYDLDTYATIWNNY